MRFAYAEVLVQTVVVLPSLDRKENYPFAYHNLNLGFTPKASIYLSD